MAAPPVEPTKAAEVKAPAEPPTSVTAQHVLVAYKGAERSPKGVTRSKADAKKRASEVAEKAKGGADFTALVAEYSDDPAAKERLGSVGKFTRDKMAKPFSDAAFTLSVNEVSAPVETPFGFHVISATSEGAGHSGGGAGGRGAGHGRHEDLERRALASRGGPRGGHPGHDERLAVTRPGPRPIGLVVRSGSNIDAWNPAGCRRPRRDRHAWLVTPRREGDPHRAARWHRLDRVAHEVAERLEHLQLVD
ncbi:MAG: peptidyl-prolyl cis-trans isomerase, partial [Myxococcales bacterium]|nr:peptidyl-prolyl cis-trans isomerase [Myxococcales bacterium]